MTLPASGSISMSQVNTELGRSASAALSLNDSTVRIVAGKPSGVISLSDLRGKAALAATLVSALDVSGNQGYRYPSYGSMTATAFKDTTVRDLYTSTSGTSMVLTLVGSRPSNYFTAVYVNGVKILSADYFYFSDHGSVSIWEWRSSKTVFPNMTAGNSFSVLIHG